MVQHSDWMRKLSDQLNATMEPMPGIPLLELFGYDRLLIENHKGIIYYASDKISIKVKFGVISVLGHGLELACMTGNKIVILGEIISINLEKGSEKCI